MDPTRSASSSKKKLGRIPSARGAVRLSEADMEKVIPPAMRPYWPTMDEKDKKEVKDILANTLYLKKECHKFKGQKADYQKSIASYKTAVKSLKEDVKDVKGKVQLNLQIQEELKKKLAENEEELQMFKEEVKTQLRNKKEADSLKSEITYMKKEIKEKRDIFDHVCQVSFTIHENQGWIFEAAEYWFKGDSKKILKNEETVYGHICMFRDITLHLAWNIQPEAPKTAEIDPLIPWTFVLVFPYCNVLCLPETFLELISTADIVVTNLMQTKTVKLHKKINIKAAQEKEVFSQFGQKLEMLKEVRDLIEKNGLLPENKLEVLNDNITDFQFDLALHENDDERIEQYNKEIEANFPIKK